MSTQFATRLALIGFATVTIRGVIELADFQITLSAALQIAALFFGLGLIVGGLARRITEEIAEQEFQNLISSRQPPDGPMSADTAAQH